MELLHGGVGEAELKKLEQSSPKHLHKFQLGVCGSNHCIDYSDIKMTSNGKLMNYKVIDFIKLYNIYISFLSTRVYINSYDF
jgi:hypothetical protein